MKDETGQKFGKLTVLKRVGRSKYECLCECGTVKVLQRSNVRSGATSSCGCMQYANRGANRLSNTVFYMRWYRKKKGGLLCEEWQDFPTFHDWLTENEATEKHVIKRIDSEKPFSPDNCFLEIKKPKEQKPPRKVAVILSNDNEELEFDSETEAAKHLGVTRNAVHSIIGMPNRKVCGYTVRRKNV